MTEGNIPFQILKMEEGIKMIVSEVMTGPLGRWRVGAEEKTGGGTPTKSVNNVEEF